MTLTLEARWFDSAPLPSGLRDWFDTLGSVEASDWTDLYLPTSDTALNLKLRDGKVQVKHRLGDPVQRSLGPHVTGRCEQWVKWSFPKADGSSSLWETNPTGLWVPVKKTRRRHRFIEADQRALSDALPTTPPAAVEIELTEVAAGNEAAWTLCLEAEGPPRSLLKTLTAAGSALFTEHFPVPLLPEQSFGYVQWLQKLPSEVGRPSSDVLISAE